MTNVPNGYIFYINAGTSPPRLYPWTYVVPNFLSMTFVMKSFFNSDSMSMTQPFSPVAIVNLIRYCQTGSGSKKRPTIN